MDADPMTPHAQTEADYCDSGACGGACQDSPTPARSTWREVVYPLIYLLIIVLGMIYQNYWLMGWGCGLLYSFYVFRG